MDVVLVGEGGIKNARNWLTKFTFLGPDHAGSCTGASASVVAHAPVTAERGDRPPQLQQQNLLVDVDADITRPKSSSSSPYQLLICPFHGCLVRKELAVACSQSPRPSHDVGAAHHGKRLEARATALAEQENPRVQDAELKSFLSVYIHTPKHRTLASRPLSSSWGACSDIPDGVDTGKSSACQLQVQSTPTTSQTSISLARSVSPNLTTCRLELSLRHSLHNIDSSHPRSFDEGALSASSLPSRTSTVHRWPILLDIHAA